MTTLPQVFADAAARAGPQTALICGDGTRISFADLKSRAEAFAATLARKGWRKGDRALVAMPVGIDLYIALAGLWMLGATVVFPEPAMGLKGLRHAIAQTRPQGFVSSGAYRWLRLLPALWSCRTARPQSTDNGNHNTTELTAEDIALISFTSGSTGAPKGIARSHGFLMAQHAAVAPLLTSAKAETDLVAFPVFILINLAEGRTSALPNWPLKTQDQVTGAALSDWIAQTQATRALLPPSLCEALAKAPKAATLQTIFTGGGPVFPDLIKTLSLSYDVTAVYGSTEAEPIAHLHAHDITEADYNAMEAGAGLLAGTPVPQVALRLQNSEVQVAGAHVNQGYLDPAHDAENKLHDTCRIWHRTGDAARLDDQGRLWLLGRMSAIAKGPDGPLYPFCIETAARHWPGVARAAVCTIKGKNILAIEGNKTHLAGWTARAQTLGLDATRHLDHLPMDARHRSKIDMARLKSLLEN